MAIAVPPAPSNYTTDAELAEIAEQQAQETFHMSTEAFLARWREGKVENPDRPEVIDLLMLIPSAW